MPQPHPGPLGRSPASEKHFALTSCRLRGPWPGPCPLPPAGAGPEGSQRWTRPSPTAGPDQDLGQKKLVWASWASPRDPQSPLVDSGPQAEWGATGGRVQQIKGGEPAVGKLRVCWSPVPWPGRGRSSSRPCQDILPNETQNAAARAPCGTGGSGESPDQTPLPRPLPVPLWEWGCCPRPVRLPSPQVNDHRPYQSLLPFINL